MFTIKECQAHPSPFEELCRGSVIPMLSLLKIQSGLSLETILVLTGVSGIKGALIEEFLFGL